MGIASILAFGSAEAKPRHQGRVFQISCSGLSGVEYVVSDEHAGLCQALTRYFPEVDHQRCQAHYLATRSR